MFQYVGAPIFHFPTKYNEMWLVWGLCKVQKYDTGKYDRSPLNLLLYQMFYFTQSRGQEKMLEKKNRMQLCSQTWSDFFTYCLLKLGNRKNICCSAAANGDVN